MMIPERAAAYVLAIVCVFQALRPSWTIRPQCRRSIDVRMGWLRMQVTNHPVPVCFEGVAREKRKKPTHRRGGCRDCPIGRGI